MSHCKNTKPSERQQGEFMMGQSAGHMNGWLGRDMWLWTVIGILVIVLGIVMFN